MKQSLGRIILIFTALTVVGSFVVPASETSGFERISTHYEGIRQALLHDTADGVSEQANEIQHLCDALEADLRASVNRDSPTERSARLAILGSVRDAASRLAVAGEITEMRAEFGHLSKKMVEYRQVAAEPALVVVFCSMTEQVWLQPAGEIGNPYYGQDMAGCGEIVSE